jgi:anhydro-N-acetylmuramic acid kinase
MKNRFLKAIGLMSGTSMDGVDVALLESDGLSIKRKNKFLYFPYPKSFQNKLRKLIIKPSLNSNLSLNVQKELTYFHIEAVKIFLKKYNLQSEDIDLIGFHGHTILHKVEQNLTWQIGDIDLLEKNTGIKTIGDLRNIDVKQGGQGAPLAPIYHHVLIRDYFDEEVIFMNIGGVINITYVTKDENKMLAGDICFGNAPMNDLIHKKLGKEFDNNGEIARKGLVNQKLSQEFLDIDFFQKKIPKSIDRNEFSHLLKKFDNLKLEDALATLIDIIAKSLEKSLNLLPKRPKKIIITGGGVKNIFMMDKIKKITNLKIINPKDLNIDVDAVEAELFSFIAIRHYYNLPFTFFGTTGRINNVNISN